MAPRDIFILVFPQYRASTYKDALNHNYQSNFSINGTLIVIGLLKFVDLDLF